MKSGKVIYYYWAYKSDGRRVYRSTKAETYEKAVRYCRNLLKTGRLAAEKSYVFATYTGHFFVYDACPYIKTRLLHGKSYTRGWAQAQRNLLTARIVPEFGEMDIRDIYESRIEGWLFRLKQENTGAKTLNHLITILRLIFAYALKAHDIESNPMDHIELFALKTAEKGIFTGAEMTMLFSDGVWDSVAHYALNLTAAMTGMRLGELLALKFENVQPGVIIVAYSWSRTDRLKCPKTGRTRQIPIPDGLYRLLHGLNRGGPQSDFIFTYNTLPMDHKSVYKRFLAALDKIGIDERERKERNITFHSYRHWFNTRLLECGLAPETVRLLTGHSAGMTARYSHIQLTNIKNHPMIDFPFSVPLQTAILPSISKHSSNIV
jgi:integrase